MKEDLKVVEILLVLSRSADGWPLILQLIMVMVVVEKVVMMRYGVSLRMGMGVRESALGVWKREGRNGGSGGGSGCSVASICHCERPIRGASQRGGDGCMADATRVNGHSLTLRLWTNDGQGVRGEEEGGGGGGTLCASVERFERGASSSAFAHVVTDGPF